MADRAVIAVLGLLGGMGLWGLYLAIGDGVRQQLKRLRGKRHQHEGGGHD